MRTSCGRNGTTSSRFRRTARSATAAGLDRRRPGVRGGGLDPLRGGGLLAKLAARPSLGAGRGARSPERGPQRRARWAAPDGASRLGGRGDDRSVGCVRGVRRPDRPRRAVAEHVRVGQFARRAPGCRWPPDRVAAVRRLAGPRRPGWPSLGGQGRLRAARERVLRAQRTPRGRRRSPPRGPRGHCRITGRSPTTSRHGRGRVGRDMPSRRRRAVPRCWSGIAPESERPGVARSLAKLVREADGRVATGFLGTPLVLPALSAAGHLDEAYRMLLRRVMPSWPYASPGCHRPSGNAGTRSCPTDRSTLDTTTTSRARRRARTLTCFRSTTTPTAR